MANTILVAPIQKTLTEQANELNGGGTYADDSDPFETALAEFPSTDDATISISRVLANNSSAFMFSYHPSEMSIAQLQTLLRDKYDGGKFRVRGMSGKKLRMNQIIQIESTAIKNNLPITSPVVAQQNNNEVVFAMMQSMTQGFQELGKLIVQSQQNNAPQYDPQEAEDRFMQRMLQMKSLFADNAPKQEMPVELFMRGMELGKELMGNVGESTSMDIMKEAVKTLGPALANVLLSSKQQPQRARPTVAPPRARVNVVAPALSPIANPIQTAHDATAIPNLTEEENMQFLIKKYISDLCAAASRGEATMPHAEKLIADFGEDTVAGYIEAGNLMTQLAGYEPDVYQHAAWFESLSIDLETLIFEDDAPAAPTTIEPEISSPGDADISFDDNHPY